MTSKAAMDSDKLPSHIVNHDLVQPHRKRSILRLPLLGMLALVFLQAALTFYTQRDQTSSSTIPIHASSTLHRCRHLHTKPGPPPDFNLREESDRFVPGTRATLLMNATIWTGGAKGFEIIEGDLLLDRG